MKDKKFIIYLAKLTGAETKRAKDEVIIGILSSVSAVHVGQIEKFEHRLPSVKYHMSGYVCFSVVRIREITTHLVLGALGFGARKATD